MDDIEESLKEIFYSVLNINRTDNCSVKREENSTIGLNFMSSIIETVFLTITDEIHLVLKIGIKNEALYEMFYCRNSYEVENYMYAVVNPAFQEFQLSKKVDIIYPHVPKYYGAFMKKVHEVFVFENLKTRGFLTSSPLTEVGAGHIELVLREIACYHAVSVAFRDQRPSLWNELTKGVLSKPNYHFSHNMGTEVALKKLGKLKTVFMKENKHFVANKLEHFIEKVDFYIEKITAIDKYSIVYHGDVWINNIMFKYEDKETPDRPTELRLIDWQASRLGHQCIDLTNFIYISASDDILDNLEYYKKIYYDNFSTYLKYLGGDPKKMFPYSAFEDQWKICTLSALIVITNVLCGILMDPDEFPDFVAFAESGGNVYRGLDMDIRKSEEYNQRMMKIIEHCVENKFL